MFSFNSPHGMCLACDGLGELYSFDPDRLVPNPALSFKHGAMDLIGLWKDLGRWKRHLYEGMADAIERKHNFEAGLLETPWQDLPVEVQQRRALWHRRPAHHV